MGDKVTGSYMKDGADKMTAASLHKKSAPVETKPANKPTEEKPAGATTPEAAKPNAEGAVEALPKPAKAE